MAFGGSAFAALLYFTDWRAVVRYIPYYNMPFKNEENEK
jgi:hypothetical protein